MPNTRIIEGERYLSDSTGRTRDLMYTASVDGNHLYFVPLRKQAVDCVFGPLEQQMKEATGRYTAVVRRLYQWVKTAHVVTLLFLLRGGSRETPGVETAEMSGVVVFVCSLSRFFQDVK